MLEKLKALEPKIVGIISIAPFISGIIVGYIFRTPISWCLDIVKLLLKI